MTGDLEYQQQVRFDIAAHLLEVHICQAAVVGPARRYHKVVDHRRQVTEEPLEGGIIRGVEGRGTQRVDLARGALETLGITAGEDQLGPFGTCSAGGFEPEARRYPRSRQPFGRGVPVRARWGSCQLRCS